MKIKSLLKSTSFLLAIVLLLSSCASTTMIRTVPENAILYIDGEQVGATPYQHTDSKIIFSNTEVRIEKEGYETYYTQFTRFEEPDAGPIVCGFFFTPIWFLWGAKYKPSRTYVLTPLAPSDQQQQSLSPGTILDSAQKLRDLKKLLDEGIITQEEFDTQKKKILDE
jgi:hypothetical protein